MGATEVAGAHRAPTGAGARLVLTIIGSAVLAGGGLMIMIYWLITLRWIDFLGVIPFGLGAWLLFTRATGPDRA